MFNSKLLKTAVILIGLLSIAACGQRGPLYLADEQANKQQNQTAKKTPSKQAEQSKTTKKPSEIGN